MVRSLTDGYVTTDEKTDLRLYFSSGINANGSYLFILFCLFSALAFANIITMFLGLQFVPLFHQLMGMTFSFLYIMTHGNYRTFIFSLTVTCSPGPDWFKEAVLSSLIRQRIASDRRQIKGPAGSAKLLYL